MKKSLAILLAVLFCLSLSACTLEIKTGGAGEQSPTSAPATQTSSGTQLTRDQALAVALQAAGLTKADVRDIDAELDRERGTLVWEVNFESGRTEYEFEINAFTGEVTQREKEPD